MFMLGKDLSNEYCARTSVMQGHVQRARTHVFMLSKDFSSMEWKDICGHVGQGRVYFARSRVFMLGKDVSPEDEAASQCPCLHLHKVLTRSLTDVAVNVPCKVGALLLGVINSLLMVQPYGSVVGGWVSGTRPSKARLRCCPDCANLVPQSLHQLK